MKKQPSFKFELLPIFGKVQEIFGQRHHRHKNEKNDPFLTSKTVKNNEISFKSDFKDSP